MKADNIPLNQFLSASNRSFCIPVYQRNYDWKRNECVTLFRDIEKIALSQHRSSHFLGTIVYVFGSNSNAYYNEFIIIDGQQRLTSIMLLLKAIMDSTDDALLKTEIYKRYLINEFGPEKLRIKLKPMKSDADAYNHLLDNSYDEDDSSQIISNYKLFMDLISSSDLEIRQIYEGILKLEIVYIQLTAESENPQLIFESLNSTGMALTQADLIRNFLLMGESYERQEELYRKYWLVLETTLPDVMISDFIRDYLTLKNNSISKKGAVYQVFKEYYQEKTNNNIEAFFIELIEYGKYYGWFKFCNSQNVSINNRLSQIQLLKSTVVYPFLLFLFYECYSLSNISEEDLCDILDIVISYVVRRLLCEIPTNILNKVFATLSRDVATEKGISLTEKVSNALIKKSGKAIFPNNDLVKEKLFNRNFYSFQHSKYILTNIERSLSKEIVQMDDNSIEHIMPQKLSTRWQITLGKNYLEIHEKNLHRLGNLTLTGYNSELSNNSFDDKKELFKNSNIKLNREISEYNTWGASEIDQRTNLLITRITDIWSVPDTGIVVDDNSVRTEYDIVDDVDVTGRTPKEVVILDEIFKVNTWRSFFITVCKQMHEYDPVLFESLTRHNDFKGRNKRIISNTNDDLRKPEKISDGIYIETNLSANDILNYSKLVVEKFEGMDTEVSYTLTDKTDFIISDDNSNFASTDYNSILSHCFDKPVDIVKNNIYQTYDSKIGILLVCSKTYSGKRRNKYWFGVRKIAIEKLKNYNDSYIAFSCGTADNMIIMPVSYFLNICNRLNYSLDTSGNISHWHIVIYQENKTKNTTLVLSKPEVKERDISNMLL